MLKKLLLSAVVLAAGQAAAQPNEPIRIGVMPVDAGAMAFFQSHFVDPVKVAIEQFNAEGGVFGRKFELVTQSHAGTPAAAMAAFSKLVQQDKISFLTGSSNSAITLALLPRVNAANVLHIDPATASDEVISKGCHPNYFRTAPGDTSQVNVLRPQIKAGGSKTWSILAPDYATGHDFVRRFKLAVEESGGTVPTVIFTPLGTSDFGAQIAQLSGKLTDGLAVAIVGADAGALAKQQKQFGFFSKYKSVLSYYFTNDIALPSQGDTTVGIYTPQSYSPDMPGPRNAALVKLWQERFKRPPSFLEGETYQAMEVLRAAILKAGSADVAAVRKALIGLKTTTVMGEVEMRGADHQLIRPVALGQIEAAGEGKARLVMRRVEAGPAVMPAAVIKCD